MPKVSIIIPIYNTEAYLEQCIKSVIDQTLKDIEIILINDGSTDSCPEICNEFATTDSRIKVIHKENSGKGASCNIGTNKANGEYLTYIDADDFLDKKMLQNLYELAKKHEADVVKSEWYRYFSNQQSMPDNQLLKFTPDIPQNIYEIPNLLRVQPSLWSAIYKTDFIKSNNIIYLETPGESFNDLSVTYKIFCYAKKIVITHEPYLYYRVDNSNSSTHSKEKAEAIFGEYAEVDKFLNNNPKIKNFVNTQKLIRQLFDYSWNYQRILPDLKRDFVMKCMQEYVKYYSKNELNNEFYRTTHGYSLSPFILKAIAYEKNKNNVKQ